MKCLTKFKKAVAKVYAVNCYFIHTNHFVFKLNSFILTIKSLVNSADVNIFLT